MKLLRTDVRVNPRDSLGQGLDAAITLVVFFGIGFALDRWLGTTPWLMVTMVVLASIGLFYKLRASYEAMMQRHDAELAARRAATTAAAATATAATTAAAGTAAAGTGPVDPAPPTTGVEPA